MERINRRLAEALRALLVLYRQDDSSFILPDKISADELVRLTNVALADEFTFYPVADNLVWDVARHEGYMIPTNPVEQRGDARDFLAEHGVENSRQWYEKRGFAPRELRQLFTDGAFMVRNQDFWRKIIPIGKTDAANVNRLAPKLIEAIDFSLGDATNETDGTLFRI